MKRQHLQVHNSTTSAMPTSQQRRSPSPVNTTPAVEPVEQRWEESEGTYLHKKFKKMASAVQSADPPPSTPKVAKESTEKTVVSTIIPPPTATISAIPIPTFLLDKPDLPNTTTSQVEPPRMAVFPPVVNQFPENWLKHSALSMLKPSAQPLQTTPSTLAVSTKVYVPAPSPSPSKVVQQLPIIVTQVFNINLTLKTLLHFSKLRYLHRNLTVITTSFNFIGSATTYATNATNTTAPNNYSAINS